MDALSQEKTLCCALPYIFITVTRNYAMPNGWSCWESVVSLIHCCISATTGLAYLAVQVLMGYLVTGKRSPVEMKRVQLFNTLFSEFLQFNVIPLPPHAPFRSNGVAMLSPI